MAVSSDRKNELAIQFGGSEANTGKTEVQIAIHTERIKQLTEHAKLTPRTTISAGSAETGWPEKASSELSRVQGRRKIQNNYQGTGSEKVNCPHDRFRREIPAYGRNRKQAST